MLKNKFLFSEDLLINFVYLTEWILIRIKGKDTIKFLHNQLTCDLKNLEKDQYTFAAHCNPHGKTISNMYIFHIQNQEIALIQKISIYKKQIQIMKKYAIFSKITIIPDHKIQLIGIFGKNAKKYLNMFFSKIPDHKNKVIHDQDTTLLYFNKPIERFLLIITNTSILNNLLNQSKFKLYINNNHQWIALDIESGYPWIEDKTSEIFIPQAINMDILKGISFNKGCYLGQESIARIQYRKSNKKILFQCITTIRSYHIHKLLKLGESLTIRKKNKKYTGIILQSIPRHKDIVQIQAVFNRSIITDNNQCPLKIKISKNNRYFVFDE